MISDERIVTASSFAFDDFIVEFCTITGLAGGTKFVGDGTFYDSYSNDYKGLYPDEIYYVRDFLTSHDKNKDEYILLYNHFYNNTETNEELESLLYELKDTVKVSIVDPDAHLMYDKDHKKGFHYNYHETTDTKYGIIAGSLRNQKTQR